MPWRNWHDDEELLRDLAEAVRPEPLEQLLIESARAVQPWHFGDGDLAIAALLYDSYTDGLVAIRGPASGAPRNLVFALGELRVEIEVSDAGIEGQLIPPEPGTVRLIAAGGPVAETCADEVGCFAFPAERRGPVRIECVVAGRRVATEWINA